MSGGLDRPGTIIPMVLFLVVLIAAVSGVVGYKLGSGHATIPEQWKKERQELEDSLAASQGRRAALSVIVDTLEARIVRIDTLIARNKHEDQAPVIHGRSQARHRSAGLDSNLVFLGTAPWHLWERDGRGQ